MVGQHIAHTLETNLLVRADVMARIVWHPEVRPPSEPVHLKAALVVLEQRR